jgi:argininosuccinate synthase
LAWLQEVLGKSSNTIYNSLGDTSTVDPMNLDAYVYGVLSGQTEDLSKEQARSFVGTLIILTNAGSESYFRRDTLERGISALIRRADEQDDHQRVVEKLRRAYEQVFPRPAPETQETNT